jgi:hypothetical protein
MHECGKIAALQDLTPDPLGGQGQLAVQGQLQILCV